MMVTVMGGRRSFIGTARRSTWHPIRWGGMRATTTTEKRRSERKDLVVHVLIVAFLREWTVSGLCSRSFNKRQRPSHLPMTESKQRQQQQEQQQKKFP